MHEFPELVFGYKKLKQDIETYRLDINAGYEGPRECLWLYGKSGAGKSSKAFEETDYYIKPLNKWFEGY